LSREGDGRVSIVGSEASEERSEVGVEPLSRATMSSNAARPGPNPGVSRWPAPLAKVVAWGRELSERLVDVRIFQNSLVLAAQAFLALFPLIILVYAIIPPGASTGLVNVLRSRVGVSGDSADAMSRLLLDREGLQQSLSAFSALLVLGSATAFTRALQRVYEGAWAMPKLGLRGVWRWLTWLTAIGLYLGLIGFIAHIIHVREVSTGVSVILAFMLWWWTPFLLLGGRVCWRALIPGAVLTTIAQVVVYVGSSVVMPRLVKSNEKDYGPIGVLFALESWLVVLAVVLVVSAAIGAILGQSQGRFAHWVRGNSDPDGWRRTPRWASGAKAPKADARSASKDPPTGENAQVGDDSW
jgi:membrane protein